MIGGKKVDTVVLGLEDNSYIKLTGEYAEAFSKLNGNFYRVLLALAHALPKEGEAIFNDGQGSVKQLKEVIL